ncbi:MAG: hypothetical protein CR993_03140 [Rhodobacterales bacterium]|nr:MAG: hypothetical protein CR993_03140 [Rhodobacterales bacterium]
MGNTNGEPIVRLVVNPDGTIALSGVKSTNGPLEPLELFNGLTVNTAAIAAAWNPAGPNTAVLDQSITGPTNASGEIEDILCFASGTLIETRDGPVPVEKLRENDAVLTYDNGYQPVRWIGSTRLTAQQLEVHPRLRPILIRANALGPGYPRQDLRVSPQHRILVSSAVAERMFGNHDVLIPANKLLGLKGIEVETDNPDGVEYWHILFEEHQIIWSNGSPTESLFVGPEALKSVSDAARQELQTLFPVLAAPDFEPLSVRKIPQKGKMVRKLIKRHRENNKPVYSKDSELLGA